MLKKLDTWVVKVNEIALVALLLVMAVIVLTNVLGRAATGQSFGWGDELARQFLVWMVMLSVGLVLRRGGHLALTMAFTALPVRFARWLKQFVLVLVLAFAAYSVWAGYGYVQLGQYQSSPVIGIPYAYVYSSIPIGFALLLYHGIASWKQYVESTDEFESLRSSGA